MNTDDGHNRCYIYIPSESLFPELFNNAENKICLKALENNVYFDIKTGNIANADIFGLPTEKLNSFMLSELKTDLCGLTCGEINKKIAETAADSAAAGGKKIAGVIGASGIYIDPFSEISFTELIAAYDEQVRALNDYVELYIISNIRSMSDMRAALLSCKKTKKPVFVTVSCDKNEADTVGGISRLGAMVTAQAMGADAFGICPTDQKKYEDDLKELLPYAKIPLITDLRGINTEPSMFIPSENMNYFIIDSNSSVLMSKKSVLTEYLNTDIKHNDDFFVFTFYSYIFFLEADTTELSEPIRCRPDMEKIISDMCKTSCDILRVEINTTDDAIDFARNANMSSLPVMFISEDALALKMALMLYQGVALIDSDTAIPEEELKKICDKYGAVVY